MPRTKINKRTRKQRQDEDWKDMVRFTELKIELTMDKMDIMDKQYKDLVDAQMGDILSRTSKKLLSTKMSDLCDLGLKRFEDYKTPEAFKPLKRSVSVSQLQSERTRKEKEIPATPTSLMRWPNSNETLVSIKGSPLAVQCLPYVSINAHIPTKEGVIELNPIKMDEVKREVVEQLDGDTLKEIKALLQNLSSIITVINRK